MRTFRLRIRGFQSIDVTKDWRQGQIAFNERDLKGFQSIDVTKDWRQRIKRDVKANSRFGFQSIDVTKDWRPWLNSGHGSGPPRFQSIDVTKDWRPQPFRPSRSQPLRFPINRRHQGLATKNSDVRWRVAQNRFQSIDVTKDWRLRLQEPLRRKGTRRHLRATQL